MLIPILKLCIFCIYKSMDFLSILILFSLALICAIFTGIFFDAIWTPTKKENYNRIAQLANIRPGITFFDLGSGSASILFYFSKKYDINCVGVEISPFWYLYSKIRSLFDKKVKIKYGDFYKYNVSDADVIYVFLTPKAYSKLKAKIDGELKGGGKLILSYWPFKDREPTKVDKKEGFAPFYLYQK